MSSAGNIAASKTKNLEGARVWGAVSDEFFLLSSEAEMRRMYPILSPWQTPLINHDTERLSNLAKVTQLINEREPTFELGESRFSP